MKRYLAAIAGLVVLCPAALAQEADLRVRVNVGDIYSYRIKSTIDAVGASGRLAWTTVFTERLSKVKVGEFYWVTEFKVSDASATGVMEGGDAAVKEMDGLTVTFISNEKGELLRSLVAGIESKAQPSANVPLPGKRTRVGETWEAKVPVGSQLLPITYKFASLDDEGKGKVAVIEGTFPKDSPATAPRPLKFWFDASTGKMLRAESRMKVTVQGAVVELHYTIERTQS